jgi:hypothetical protein
MLMYAWTPKTTLHCMLLILVLKAAEDSITCTAKTVELASMIYARDLAILGYNMTAAYHSCATYGLAEAP